MELLQILIKERNLKWHQIIAETAEKFTAMNALHSSGFQLALAKCISDELEERSSLYYTHSDDTEDLKAFGKFFENQEESLSASVFSRFGEEVPRNTCEIIREKYEAILSSRSQQKTKKVIGFHTY